MPKKTKRKILVRAYMLRDLTLNQIVDRLADEFPDEVLPDRSTIARNRKKFESSLPDELAEDTPFKWSEMKVVPWEHTRVILDIAAYYARAGSPYGPYTNRLAKWCWRVMNAFNAKPSIEEPWRRSIVTEVDVLFVAYEYCWREIATAVLKEPFETYELDTFLSFAPWAGTTSPTRSSHPRNAGVRGIRSNAASSGSSA